MQVEIELFEGNICYIIDFDTNARAGFTIQLHEILASISGCPSSPTNEILET